MAVISKTLTLETTFDSWTEVGDQVYQWVVENFPNLTFWKMRNNTTDRHTYAMWYGSEKIGGIEFGNYGLSYANFHIGPFRAIDDEIRRPYTDGPAMAEGGTLTLQLIDVDGAVLFGFCSVDNSEWYAFTAANCTNVVTNEPVFLSSGRLDSGYTDDSKLLMPKYYITAEQATTTMELYPNIVSLTGLLGDVSLNNVANISTYMYGEKMLVQLKNERLCTLIPNSAAPWSQTQGTEIIVGDNTYMYLEDNRYVRIS